MRTTFWSSRTIKRPAIGCSPPWTGVFFPLYTECEKGHGRIEQRTIQLTPRVKGLRFPHAEQGFRLERTTTLSNGKTRHEVVYGATSQPPDRADEKKILGQIRGHWTVESLHHVRDVTYDEDRCRIRTGNGPQAMAALRNLATTLIKTFVAPTVAAGNRALIMNVPRLLDLVGA